MFKLSVSTVSSEVNSAYGDSDDAYYVIPLIQLAKINIISQVGRETSDAFHQHVSIEDDSEKWEKNLIKLHLTEAPTETTSDSDLINDSLVW